MLFGLLVVADAVDILALKDMRSLKLQKRDEFLESKATQTVLGVRWDCLGSILMMLERRVALEKLVIELGDKVDLVCPRSPLLASSCSIANWDKVVLVLHAHIEFGNVGRHGLLCQW